MPELDLDNAPEGTALFFGCIGEPGHYLYETERQTLSRGYDRMVRILGKSLDGKFVPPVSQEQGAALLTHLNGWTILGWHDYTGDSRGGSNSNFLVKGTYKFEQMKALLMHRFPKVYNRQNKQLVLRTLG